MATGGRSRTLAGQGCLRLPDEGIRSGTGVTGACGLLDARTELESGGASGGPTC